MVVDSAYSPFEEKMVFDGFDNVFWATKVIIHYKATKLGFDSKNALARRLHRLIHITLRGKWQGNFKLLTYDHYVFKAVKMPAFHGGVIDFNVSMNGGIFAMTSFDRLGRLCSEVTEAVS
jgi:hypothetical protein